ncbi:PHP domain-containing protein [Pontibacter sp. JAM-7]|uniref:PHP domain-containing protein n=1 Tax=Pontibacter sp. JAM-7 TaxID=3366581 RepID=UPI003AF8CEE3
MSRPLPRYDLHCHSSASDGTLLPEELLERAVEKEIDVLALTDHDTVAGVLSLQRSGLSKQLKLISGVELTCQWEGRVVHLLGLGIDPESVSLQEYLTGVRQLRVERGQKITQRLRKLQLPDLHDQARDIAGSDVLGRPHIAKAMVASGVVGSEQEAFKRYLGAGKSGDVKAVWPELETTVAVVTEAKGFALVAHPTKYKMTFSKLRRLLHDFVIAGGHGIEVAYPGVTSEQQKHLLRIAEQYDLMVSGGSDFHSPSYTWTELGRFPQLMNTDNHVLCHL